MTNILRSIATRRPILLWMHALNRFWPVFSPAFSHFCAALMLLSMPPIPPAFPARLLIQPTPDTHDPKLHNHTPPNPTVDACPQPFLARFLARFFAFCAALMLHSIPLILPAFPARFLISNQRHIRMRQAPQPRAAQPYCGCMPSTVSGSFSRPLFRFFARY